MKTKFLTLIVFLSLLIITSCEEDDDMNISNDNQFELVDTNFRAILPEEISVPENKTFKFANAYGEYLADQSNGTSSRTTNNLVNNQTSSEVKTLMDGGFQLNYLLDNNDNIVMCSIADLQTSSEEFLIDAETTAISMLMTHPLLITSFQENYNSIVETIKSLETFEQYVSEVSQLITNNVELNTQLDYSDTETYRQLIVELYNETMENAQVPLANGGLQFDLQSRNNGVLTYTFTNHFKRTLHIYPKKVWLDSNGFPLNEEEYEDNIFPLMDVMTADGLNIWNTITTFNFSEPYEKTTNPISIDLGDADQLKLEVYGVGKLHKDFEDLSDEEILKMSIVGVHGGYRDFIRPLFDMILGLKNFQSTVGSDQHFDFRYGSRSEPLRQLFIELASNFSSDPLELDNLRENLQDEDYVAIAWQFPKYCINQILSDSQPEEEKRRYLNYIYNAMKNITGVSSTSDSFRSAIKKGANQIAAIKNGTSVVGQVINIGELSVDVASAIYAYNQSEFREDVRVNKTSETTLSLLTPIDNYLIEENENSILFEWDFDRGNHIGNVTYELNVIDPNDNSILQSIDTQNDKFYNLSLSALDQSLNQFNWQVLAKSNEGTLTSSEVWTFMTEAPEVFITDFTFLSTRFTTSDSLRNFSFSKNGLHLYMVINGQIQHFALPAPYDLSNISTPDEILILDSSQGGSSVAEDVVVNQDGTILYVQADRSGSFNNDYLQQYNLSNPYSINNVSYVDRYEVNYKYNKIEISGDDSRLFIAYHDFFSLIRREIREFEFTTPNDITSVVIVNSTPQIYESGQVAGISYDIIDDLNSIYVTDDPGSGLTKKFIMSIPGDISSIDDNQPQSSINLNAGERIIKVVGNEERFFTMLNTSGGYQINEYVRN